MVEVLSFLGFALVLMLPAIELFIFLSSFESFDFTLILPVVAFLDPEELEVFGFYIVELPVF